MHDFLLTALIYVAAGVFAGLMSGILGIGGGLVVVPALLYIFQHDALIPLKLSMHFAAGTSLAVMIFTSQSSIYSHLKLGDILWRVYNCLWPGIFVGVMVGSVSAYFIPTRVLEMIFGLFLLVVGFKMLWGEDVAKHRQFPRGWINALVTFIIGFKSGLLGVGGGVLVIPYLTYCGVEARKIAAVSSLCTLTVAVLGTLIFILTGSWESGLPTYATGFIYWPAVIAVALPSVLFAPLGAKLNYILPVKQLRYGFVVILFFTAWHLLF